MGEHQAHGQPDKVEGQPSERKGWKEFFSLGEVGEYFFRKKDPQRPSNINLKMMHGVNKISIVIFLLGVLYLVYKLAIKPGLE